MVGAGDRRVSGDEKEMRKKPKRDLQVLDKEFGISGL